MNQNDQNNSAYRNPEPIPGNPATPPLLPSAASSPVYLRPIELAPDQDDEEEMTYRRNPVAKSTRPDPANQETAHDPIGLFQSKGNSGVPLKNTGEPLRWALDALHQPAMAAADWLARDIDATQSTATALLTNPAITLEQVRQAKTVYKTMRIVGEKSSDRRVGARMYAASIAAGLVRHGKKVSTQSDEALKRGFQALLDDRRMPLPLRDLAGLALCAMSDMAAKKTGDRKKSA